MAETDLAQIERVADKIIALAPKMRDTKVRLLEQIGRELNLHEDTLRKYVRVMNAIKDPTKSVTTDYRNLLQRLKNECGNNPALREKILRAIEAYAPHDTIETTERIIGEILALAEKGNVGKAGLAKRIAANLQVDPSTVHHHVQALRALQGKTKPPPEYVKAHWPSLQRRYTEDHRFRNDVAAALKLYAKYATFETTKNIISEILAMKRENATNNCLAEEIAAKLGLDPSTVHHHVQTLRALQGQTDPSTDHLTEHFPRLKRRYEEDLNFRKDVDEALRRYPPPDAVETTIEIIKDILSLAKDENASKYNLVQEISARLKINPWTFQAHMQALRALRGQTEPPPEYAKVHFSLLKTMYNDGAFRKRADAAVECWDVLLDLAVVEHIIADLTKYAQYCKKTKQALKEYVAKKNRMGADHLLRYIHVMRTVVAHEKPSGRLIKLYPTLEHKCKNDGVFAEKMRRAVELYDAVTSAKTISYEELLDQAGISLEKHKAQKPAGDKTEWIKTDLLKRVPLVAIEKLAGTNGTNALIMRAISDAEKTGLN